MLLDTVSGMTGGQGINRLIFKESIGIAGGDNPHCQYNLLLL